MNQRIWFIPCPLYSIAKKSSEFLTGDFFDDFLWFWLIFGGLSSCPDKFREIWCHASVWTKASSRWTGIRVMVSACFTLWPVFTDLYWWGLDGYYPEEIGKSRWPWIGVLTLNNSEKIRKYAQLTPVRRPNMKNEFPWAFPEIIRLQS